MKFQGHCDKVKKTAEVCTPAVFSFRALSISTEDSIRFANQSAETRFDNRESLREAVFL